MRDKEESRIIVQIDELRKSSSCFFFFFFFFLGLVALFGFVLFLLLFTLFFVCLLVCFGGGWRVSFY